MHTGQHLPTHSQVQCTQVNTYQPTHRYSASRSTPTYTQVQCTQVNTYLPTHRYSAPRSTPTSPLTGTVHPGQHLTTHRYSAPRSTPTYPLTGTVHPGQHLTTVTETLFTGMNNECFSEGTRVPVFHDQGCRDRWHQSTLLGIVVNNLKSVMCVLLLAAGSVVLIFCAVSDWGWCSRWHR